MYTPNLEFNFLSKTCNDSKKGTYRDENFNYLIDTNLNNNDENIDELKTKLNQIDKSKFNERGNLTTNHNFNNLNNEKENESNLIKNLNKIKKFDVTNKSNSYEQDKFMDLPLINPSFRSSWPVELSKSNKLTKLRRLSLTESYPHQKLINFTIKSANTRHEQVRRQNSAPEQRRKKPFDETIPEEDEKQIDQQTNEIATNQTSKANQVRLRRRQPRYRTQPITFDEIKEVREEEEDQCLNNATDSNDQDNSINKLVNFHISENLK